MAIPTWPAAVPDPLGLFGTLGTGALYAPPKETEFDDGPPRTRRRQLFDETPRTISLRLTRGEFAAFRTFVSDTLNSGARRFTARVRLPDGSTGTRTCRISGPVSEQDRGASSVVAFTLVVQDWR